MEALIAPNTKTNETALLIESLHYGRREDQLNKRVLGGHWSDDEV